MLVVSEEEKEYRHGDHGPKYLMKGPKSNFGIIQLRPGEVVSRHVHKVMEENFYILNGKMKAWVDGRECEVAQGEMLHLEPGELHQISNPTSEYMQMIVTAAPYCDGDKYEE